ncbi:single-stranded DNA-binding protein [Pseudarthrobacter sp. NamE2]|uniref:single-stranded DNA-binding protein n=1 Tax=Pseudarthrobacter sp. NamE2 TaxID=2576838 RepID=UPI0010FE726B|nr:single-stranded DNA-binding protein [Pseudarthrobacter sp. NamE2]TLM83654.1 single-stranded DNA-binding protein [Pseudarthrobacter sp. NamE2]
MTTPRPVVGYNLSPRIPLEVDLFRQVNPSGRIIPDAVDPYVVEPAIVEPLVEDLYDGYAVPDQGGDDGYLEAINRAPLGEGGLWDEHTANQYQLNDLTHDEPGGTELQNEPATDTENITSTRGKGTIMAGETTITVIGNLTSEPELRFTPSGSAVANFTIASTPRTFDRQSNEWKDGETLFLRASVWREAAENVAESLTKGTRVIATGRLKSRSYETKEGEKRTVIELEVDDIGPSLRYANAKVNRTQRSPQGGQGNGYQVSASNQPQSGPQDDPWVVPANSNAAGGWGNGPDSEPPF